MTEPHYPPGVHSGTRNAPWNAPIPPTCNDCGKTINSIEDHDGHCPCEMDSQELAEYWAEERNHVDYDPLEHTDR